MCHKLWLIEGLPFVFRKLQFVILKYLINKSVENSLSTLTTKPISIPIEILLVEKLKCFINNAVAVKCVKTV